MTVGGRSTTRSPKMHAIINDENDGFALLSLSRAREPVAEEALSLRG